MSGIEIVLLLVFSAAVIGITLFKQSRLNDPTNTTFIYIDQMLSNHQLIAGPVEAVLYRQSGNEYRALGVFGTPEAALQEVLKAFRRAKIESVSVLSNSTTKFEVIRLHHGHGGKAEGKKLGGAVLVSRA